MNILGISALNHDASVTLLNNKEILFSGHAERYSLIKNDPFLNTKLLTDCLKHGQPDKVVFFERPYLKKTRQLYARQYNEVFSTTPSRYLKSFNINSKIHYVQHHASHACASYFTSPYDESAIVVIDAIGEWETCTIWYVKGNQFEKRYSVRYPNSLGLWYSAMTQRLGLKPQEDEYILMGMAGWGTIDKELKQNIYQDFFRNPTHPLPIRLNQNLHKGCLDWNPDYYKDDGSDEWKFNIAANVQSICEDEIRKVFELAQHVVRETDNMCYGGGVALNCVANSMIAREYYPNLWIIPNPGDAGSSLGCAAYLLGEHVNWENTFLGYDIKGEYPVNQVSKELLKGNIVGVASGRAEYGPRALGNRSLLADPRGDDIKDRVNKIKKRQEFRPFAPAVLEEHAHKIFDMPVKKSQYMQFVADCKYPKKYPAICHVDGTSRVQTVSKDDNPNFYELINQFYKQTGCPMVLNTSLNIKGQPIVNTYTDGIAFSKKYGVKVYS
jgi:carbamoyltransferase